MGFLLTVAGAFNQGFFMKEGVFSKKLIAIGGIIIPGTAIPILEGITWEIADIAAFVLSPTSFPSSVSIIIPLTISC